MLSVSVMPWLISSFCLPRSKSDKKKSTQHKPQPRKMSHQDQTQNLKSTRSELVVWLNEDPLKPSEQGCISTSNNHLTQGHRAPARFTVPFQFHRPAAGRKPSETNADLQRSLARTPGTELQNTATNNICHLKPGLAETATS